MAFDWCNVESCFSSAPKPDLGDHKLWMNWYQDCWSRIGKAGLLEARDGLDVVRIKLRAIVLVWLAREFCEVAQQNVDVELDWEEMADGFNLPEDGIVLVALTAEPRIPLDAIHEAWADGDESLWDSGNHIDDWGMVLNALGIALATRERRTVLDALFTSFDGEGPLFQSMYAPSITSLFAISEKKLELEEELDDLRDDLQDAAGNEPRHEMLRARADEIERTLNDPQAIQKLILDDCEDELMEPVYYGDDDFIHREVTLEWIMSGCPIWISGGL